MYPYSIIIYVSIYHSIYLLSIYQSINLSISIFLPIHPSKFYLCIYSLSSIICPRYLVQVVALMSHWQMMASCLSSCWFSQEFILYSCLKKKKRNKTILCSFCMLYSALIQSTEGEEMEIVAPLEPRYWLQPSGKVPSANNVVHRLIPSGTS